MISLGSDSCSLSDVVKGVMVNDCKSSAWILIVCSSAGLFFSFLTPLPLTLFPPYHCSRHYQDLTERRKSFPKHSAS